MQGKLTNRYTRKVRVYIYSKTGSGYYEIDPGYWVWSGDWSSYDKYMVVYDYATWKLYGCRIISPHHAWWYDVIPSAPNDPPYNPDPGTPVPPTGGGDTGEAPSDGQHPNP